MTPPTLSIVISTYDRRDGLPAVVAAALADPYATEVVVVVDGCADGSYELLEKLAVEEPRLRPVWRANGGAAAARATGVERAGGEIVLLLDDDVLAGPGLAEGHARAHAGRAGLVVVGALLTEAPPVRAPGDVTTLLYAEDYERAAARYERDPSTVLPYLWAGNLSLRRADALRVGLASGRRLNRHNDQEFGLRCARAGLTGVFDRSLAARHLHARDLGNFARQAWQAGTARRALGRSYPDLLADTDPRRDVPAPLRPAIGLAAAPGLHRLARPVLGGGLRLAGRARWWWAETAFARVLRQVELLRGYRDAA
ncbi:glycosyltransferase [Micromonospora sp. NPDC049559]|uniref:glycosyltransferase n=1 Tax=Micromonospora sp. NPDC049559 TaxID=3155923 RepID=UPI003424193A